MSDTLDHTNTDDLELPPGLSDREEPAYEIVDQDDEEQHQPVSGPAAPAGEDFRGEEDDENLTPKQRSENALRNKERRQRMASARARSEQTIRDQQAEIERLRAEADDYRKFKGTVESRFSQSDRARQDEQVNTVQRQIDETAVAVDRAVSQMSEAIANGDAEAHGRALRENNRLIARGISLENEKARLESARQAPQPQQETRQDQPQYQQPAQRPRPMDPVVAERTRDFQRTHPWINFQNPDEDTEIALAIDRAVARQYQPNTDEYWEELEDRMRQRLPHRFQQRTQARRPVAPERRGPMAGPSGNGGQNPGPRRIVLDQDRKSALILAGYLDPDGKTVRDKVAFDRTVKGYLEQDRQNGAVR